MNWMQEFVCPACGKEFVIPYTEQWTYKTQEKTGRTHYYCSYRCWLGAKETKKSLREKQDERRRAKGKLIDDMRREGMNYKEIAEKLNMTMGMVYYIYNEYKGIKSLGDNDE